MSHGGLVEVSTPTRFTLIVKNLLDAQITASLGFNPYQRFYLNWNLMLCCRAILGGCFQLYSGIYPIGTLSHIGESTGNQSVSILLGFT